MRNRHVGSKIVALNIGITIFIVVLLLISKRLEWRYITCYISLYVFANIILLDILKTGKIISLITVFNVFGILYSDFYIFQTILFGNNLSNNSIFACNLTYLSMISFDMTYYLTKRRVKFCVRNRINNNKTNYTVLLALMYGLTIISIFAEVYVIFINIGFANFVSATRAQKSLLSKDYSVLTFYTMTIPLTQIICMMFWMKGEKRFRYLAIFTLVISVFNSLISVSRAELISVLLPMFYLLEQANKIKDRHLIILIIGSFILFGVWKSLFSSSRIINIYYDSEFNSWYKIFNNILQSDLSKLFGTSYIKTLVNLVIPFTKTEPLSVWYVRNYEYETWISGGGRGFSGVLEAYMNFGIIGCILVYSIYGYIVKQIALSVSRGMSDLSNIIYMIVLFSMFRMFRSESYSLLKTMMWFKIYPAALIMFISNNINKYGSNNYLNCDAK